ncbi:TIGR02587 family membrane protein [soil metagenome]
MSAQHALVGWSFADRDCLLRACAGALLGALPLLYTMEMWWYGRTISDGALLALLVVTAGIVLISLLFGGFRLGRSSHLAMDVLITFGIGIIISLITLLAVGQIQPGRLPLSAAVRMVGIEAIPCAIGAALAVTQFRPRKRGEEQTDRRIDALPEDFEKILATLVGGIFFGFNIAPTDEPWKMMIEAEPYHFPLIVLFSLLVSYMVVFLADFAERPSGYDEGALGSPLAETLVSYLLSLSVAYGFLIAFGHITPATPLYYQAAGTVMLGYVTTIGGSAGRVLVAE